MSPKLIVEEESIQVIHLANYSSSDESSDQDVIMPSGEVEDVRIDDEDEVVDVTPAPEILAEENAERADSYLKDENYDKALDCYGRAIRLQPESAEYYAKRSSCRLMMESYADALQDAHRSIQLDSGNAQTYVRLAKCHLALGDSGPALDAVDRAPATLRMKRPAS